MDENLIIEKIKEILSTITGIAVVYDGIPVVREEFPAVSIMPLSWEDKLYSLRDNMQSGKLQISVYTLLDETNGGDIIEKQKAMRSLVATIRNQLSTQINIQLDGAIDWSDLTTGEYSFDEKETKLYICSLVYNVRKLFDRQAT
jgi:hypothetical protein